MNEQDRHAADRDPAAHRMLLTTASFGAADIRRRCGDDCYSYYFVQRAFAPLLERWATVREVAEPDKHLDQAVVDAQQRNRAVAHLSFLPLQYMPLARRAPNAGFPFWEFPDIPTYDVGHNPRNNWLDMSTRLDLILTACRFTRDAFLRAGVRTPLAVVSVPIRPDYFEVPAWEQGQRVVIECPAWLLGTSCTDPPARPAVRQRLRQLYRHRIKPRLPGVFETRLARAGRLILGRSQPSSPDVSSLPAPTVQRLELSGIVYTTILNPFDQRKHWPNMIEAFLSALADEDDATLVVKLAVSNSMMETGLRAVFDHYRNLGVRHRSKLVVISAYLSDQQMVELAQASTYYFNASKAEGACLPLQDFLAAGRPGIAPAHTAMAEYIDREVAFVVASQRRPAHWLWDPEQRTTTTWHEVQRDSLVEQLRASYLAARHDPGAYRSMADCGRRRMWELASDQHVWPRLAAALKLLETAAGATREPYRQVA